MAEITNELMYELMKRMHGEMANLRDGQNDLRQDFISLRNHMHVMQGDVNNLRTTMAQVLIRLDCIENRLELRELSEAQARFEPHP
jgi:DnaJ-domain-containing protein 1